VGSAVLSYAGDSKADQRKCSRGLVSARSGAAKWNASDQGPLYRRACDGEYARYRARVVTAARPFSSSGGEIMR
jgi:hypothetical protein